MKKTAHQRPPAGLPETATLDDYRQFVACHVDWTWETDAEHRFTAYSEVGYSITGLQPADLIGRSRLDVLREIACDSPHLEEHFRQFENRQPYRDFLMAVRTPAQNKMWLTTSGYPRYDENGEFLGYRGSARESSDMVRMARQLDDANAERSRLSALLDAGLNAISSAILVFDPDDILIFFNDALKTVFPAYADTTRPGIALRDFLYSGVKSGFFVHDRKIVNQPEAVIERAVDAYLERLSESGYIVEQLSDGRWCAFEINRLESGMLIIVVSDVTKRKQRTHELKQAKSEVEESRKLLQSIVDNIPLSITVFDKDDRFLMTNRQNWERQPEMSPVLRPGSKLHEVIRHAHSQGLWRNLGGHDLDALYDENPQEWIARKVEECRDPDFDVTRSPSAGKWFRTFNRRLSNGVTLRVSMDISDLKNKQEELAVRVKENELFRNVIEAVPAAISVRSADQKLVYANSAWSQFSGVSFADAKGKTDIRTFGKQVERRFLDDDREVLESDKVKQVERTDEMPDGSIRYRMARKSKATGSDGSVYIVGVSTDITDMKEREREAIEARAHAELAQSILDEFSSPVMAKDQDGHIVVINKAFEAINGYPGQTILGKTAAEVYAPGQIEQVTRFEADVMRTGTTFMHEHVVTRADGTEFEANSIKSRHRLADGKDYMIIHVEDITDFREREDALRDARRKAEAADRAKSEFLAKMSHEIRTPMNGVLGMAELLSATDLDSRQRTFADIIVKSGNALLQIINDVLDFSKIDANQMKLQVRPFELRELVYEVAEVLGARARQKDIEIVVDIDPAIGERYVGDDDLLRRVMSNLVGNAVKFTEFGHVLIEVEVQQSGEETELTFKVSDTGVGIPNGELDKIFEKFVQVDSSTTSRHDGTGLGLAISSSIIKLMGGDLCVQSTVGEGSAFWFTITLPPAENAISVRGLPPIPLGTKICLIDDNQASRAMQVVQLSAHGIECTGYESGAAGLSGLRAAAEEGQPFAGVIIDLEMPGMSGMDVAAAIRADTRMAGLPLVLLSPLGADIPANEIGNLCIDAVLPKPLRCARLHEAVAKVIGEPRDSSGKEEPPAEAAAAGVHAPETPVARIAEIAPSARQYRDDESAREHAIDVLVAEDNSVNQLVFSQILLGSGYRFEIASDGRQAVEVNARKNPRLILMDIAMPEMNGLEATAEVRARDAETGSHTPIIGVTAHAHGDDREKCLEAGMDDCMSKPISPHVLIDKIESIIGKGEHKRISA